MNCFLKRKRKGEKIPVKRFDVSVKEGLNSRQAEQRIDENYINKAAKVKGKSHLNIIFTSFFTFFNVILYALAIVFLCFQLFYPDGLKYIPITKYGFLFVILCNALTSIISQEISKKTVEKMKLIADPKAEVLRESDYKQIKVDEIVLDDIVHLKSGNEVPCDLIIKKGNLLVNESMLTGESKALNKTVGDVLLSGSFVISGDALALADKVGNETYVSKLEHKISSIKKKQSILMVNINKIIKYLLFFLFPAVFVVGLKTYYVGVDGQHWVFTLDVITKSAATLVGMIPIGMILLSSITLSESIIKLFRKKTMVQELYAIENLSRVTTLCLDKTGTLTTQRFLIDQIIKFKDVDVEKIMGSYLAASTDGNETIKAFSRKFKLSNKNEVERFEPFDSAKKHSTAYFKNGDIYSLGAPEYIFKDKRILKKVSEYSSNGYRVLGLTKNNVEIALFLLKDELRSGIKNTLKYFSDLNVDIKIISGDNPLTVGEVSKQAGVKNADKIISMENIKLEEIANIVDKYTIFGRTSPDQKQEIIKQLELKGEMVGYIGDGVNDTQSLRQANCSIALKSGADSTKAVSDVVLLDDDFSHLPDVLKEGRRVVSNIQRSILLFLTKSIFIGLFSFATIFMKEGMPIEIETIYIYEFISVALCGFLLSIENNKPVADDGNFVSKVLFKSFAFGLFMFIGAIFPVIVNAFYPLEHLPALITLNVTISGLVILFVICKPLTKYTKIVFAIGAVLSALALIALPNIFLDPLYLKQANNLSEQMRLLFGAFFNLELYRKIMWPEYLIVATFFLISYPLFLGIQCISKQILILINKIKKKVQTT